MTFFQQHNIKRSLFSFFILSLAVNSLFSYATDQKLITNDCHPLINLNRSQFIVGYGSLMQEKSKREDDTNVGENHPIYITGFNRGWIKHGTPIGFSTTYLAVVSQPTSKINAVYFRLNDSKDVGKYDQREDSYCRVAVSPKQIKTTFHEALPQGQYWIYITNDGKKDHPSSQYPIVQSYVDIFLSGCFELEEKYHLRGFARDCIKMTSAWSDHWVNDRVHPRTAFDNDPYVQKIDPLIATELPHYFNQIKIEGG